MKSVDAHLADCLALVAPLAPREVPLLDAAGCVLAADVTSPWDLPPFANSAMDGYAVHAADVASADEAAPAVLPVVADIAAGSGARVTVEPGTSARIMTGAPMPGGADAVVPVEWTDGGTDSVRILQPASPRQHVRDAGGDLRHGSLVLAAGTLLGSAHVGLLSAVGCATVTVHPRPRVVVLATGDELVEPGTRPAYGQITDSNSYLLVTAALAAGAEASRRRPLADDADRLLESLQAAAAEADLLLTTGGVSAGAYDVVKEVLAKLGTVAFEKVAMRPGMPQGHGTLGETPILTLPGNPVSSAVSFEVFGRPMVRRLRGLTEVARQTRPASLTAAVTSPAGKREYVRVRTHDQDGRLLADLLAGQGSHQLATFAHANALAVVPEDRAEMSAGDQVDVLLLEEPE